MGVSKQECTLGTYDFRAATTDPDTGEVSQPVVCDFEVTDRNRSLMNSAALEIEGVIGVIKPSDTAFTVIILMDPGTEARSTAKAFMKVFNDRLTQQSSIWLTEPAPSMQQSDFTRSLAVHCSD